DTSTQETHPGHDLAEHPPRIAAYGECGSKQDEEVGPEAHQDTRPYAGGLPSQLTLQPDDAAARDSGQHGDPEVERKRVEDSGHHLTGSAGEGRSELRDSSAVPDFPPPMATDQLTVRTPLPRGPGSHAWRP